ncbi:hypothetical protein ZWY2020_049159 [Hordeum vulgare]|nr:hypothetical protein ZWY2020_049159 [Hordeum vulgare]
MPPPHPPHRREERGSLSFLQAHVLSTVPLHATSLVSGDGVGPLPDGSAQPQGPHASTSSAPPWTRPRPGSRPLSFRAHLVALTPDLSVFLSCSRMMSDCKVRTVNDGMQEFLVEFRGLEESSFLLVLLEHTPEPI